MKPRPTVSLTFDDGPSRWTPALLDVLDRAGARATFFVLGDQVEGRESVLRRAVAGGHEVGVHGWTHEPVDDLDVEVFRDHLDATVRAIVHVTDVWPRWWRPPWHRTTRQLTQAAASAGLAVAGVTVDGLDVSRGTTPIVNTVTDGLADGAVVGLHDGVAVNGEQYFRDRWATVAAVSVIVERCWSVTLSELAAAGMTR